MRYGIALMVAGVAMTLVVKAGAPVNSSMIIIGLVWAGVVLIIASIADAASKMDGRK